MYHDKICTIIFLSQIFSSIFWTAIAKVKLIKSLLVFFISDKEYARKKKDIRSIWFEQIIELRIKELS